MASESDTSDRELVIRRTFDAPRELVWKAWTDPKHVVNWWGPNGFTNTIHEMDVRPGGVWRLTMHGPDGTNWPNKITFLEVVPPARLVYDHGDDIPGGEAGTFRVTATFDEQNGKTACTFRMLFKTAAERKRVVDEFGATEGANQTFARLAEYLKQMRN